MAIAQHVVVVYTVLDIQRPSWGSLSFESAPWLMQSGVPYNVRGHTLRDLAWVYLRPRRDEDLGVCMRTSQLSVHHVERRATEAWACASLAEGPI